jgi:hypothetical protein
VGQVADLVEGAVELGLEVVEGRERRVGIRWGELPCLLEPDHERNEPLLCAVVQVALDAAPFGVGAGDDARPRGAQLVGLALQRLQRRLQRGVEPRVVKSESDLAAELSEHLVLAIAERLAVRRTLGDDQPEELTRPYRRGHPQQRALAFREQRPEPNGREAPAGHALAGHDRLFGGQ